MTTGRIFKVLNVLMAALFVYAAAVQYNDPDPVRWIAIYLAAATICAWEAAATARWWAALLVADVALVWAIFTVMGMSGQVGVGELFTPRGMFNLAVEEAREATGLFLVATWLMVVAVVELFRAKRRGGGENARRAQDRSYAAVTSWLRSRKLR